MSTQSTYNPVSQQLINWYREHRRTMPWRGEVDPYLIWLSEIILQQTRIEQGRPYYERFVTLFPSVQALADSEEESVMKAWEGLGYYSRARNLHKTSKIVTKDFNGQFPQSYSALKELPGIGEYTAAAIASICYEEHIVVVDGNVNRLITRLYGIDEMIGSSAGKKIIRASAQALMSNVASAGEFNQALMEFGALQCIPKKPNCKICPLAEDCVALREGMITKLPVKKKAKASRDRYFLYRIPIMNGFTYIQKRSEKDIWSGLYEFSLSEQKGNLDTEPLVVDHVLADVRIKQILSHQNIYARFIVYEGAPRYGEEKLNKIEIDEVSSYPFSRLSTRFMEKTSRIWNPEEE